MNHKLEAIFKSMESKRKEFIPELDKQAKKIEKIDLEIIALNEKISVLEKQKNCELEAIQELFDLAVISSHRCQNGYTIKSAHDRKMKIINIKEFLAWMKINCEPIDVLDFLACSIKSTNLKLFANNQCDKMRQKGIIQPSIDGLEIGETGFRRLTTNYKEFRK